jgi:hypothetical protein
VRVFVDLVTDAGQLICACTWADQTRIRNVRLIESGSTRMLVAQDDPVSDADAAALAVRVDQGTANMDELAIYGELLFSAAFGDELWRELVERPASDPCIELAIRGRADSEKPAAHPLHAMRWEALNDGTVFIAARGARAQSGKTVSVALVRLVSAAADHLAQPLLPIVTIPRVLFAVGSQLSDSDVRPGAEFMGIMRHLERNGGWIQPRVLEAASLEGLTDELRRFKPDVLHIIGHGTWDAHDHCVKLQLRLPEAGADGDDYVTAAEILGAFDIAGHVPAMVVLSACQTGSAVNALSFAARLVAGGVPAVAAMAGDISDTACRVFTRSLTTAIGQADPLPLSRAVIVGRRAAFYDRDDPKWIDWIMPVLFLAEDIPGDTCLVDTTTTVTAMKRVISFGLAPEPVFCGRGEFIDGMDRLLDEDDPLNILVAHTSDAVKGFGGYRLLQELGARAVRVGCLPVLLGPFDQHPPTTKEDLGEEFRITLGNLRRKLGLEVLPSRFATACNANAKPDVLADELRADLDDMVRELPDTDPVRTRSGYPKAVLLCHRVDKWISAMDVLLAMLKEEGLGAGVHPVPVVLTGTDTTEQGLPLREMKGSREHALWIRFAELARFREDGAYPEDIRAYQYWLLNPPEGRQVFTPIRTSRMNWHGLLRAAMKDRPALYESDVLFNWAQEAVNAELFTADKDNDVLTTFSRVAP